MSGLVCFFIDIFLLIVGFSVFESVRRSSLKAGQMCFCPIKRKSRLKPAKFFHRPGGDGKRFIVPADEKLTAFMELQRAIHEFAVSLIS